MKRFTTTLILTTAILLAHSQANITFLRSDTTELRSGDCNWLIPPQPGPGSAAKTVGEWFLRSVRNGKLRAADPETGKLIPAGKIHTWGMPADTVAVFDENAEISKYQVVQAELDALKISKIKIQQDWYLDTSTGKLFPKTKWMDLMIEVYSYDGVLRGYRPFCRISY
jgi:hypothetical protein